MNRHDREQDIVQAGPGDAHRSAYQNCPAGRALWADIDELNKAGARREAQDWSIVRWALDPLFAVDLATAHGWDRFQPLLDRLSALRKSSTAALDSTNRMTATPDDRSVTVAGRITEQAQRWIDRGNAALDATTDDIGPKSAQRRSRVAEACMAGIMPRPFDVIELERVAMVVANSFQQEVTA